MPGWCVAARVVPLVHANPTARDPCSGIHIGILSSCRHRAGSCDLAAVLTPSHFAPPQLQSSEEHARGIHAPAPPVCCRIPGEGCTQSGSTVYGPTKTTGKLPLPLCLLCTPRLGRVFEAWPPVVMISPSPCCRYELCPCPQCCSCCHAMLSCHCLARGSGLNSRL